MSRNIYPLWRIAEQHADTNQIHFAGSRPIFDTDEALSNVTSEEGLVLSVSWLDAWNSGDGWACSEVNSEAVSIWEWLS